MAEDEPTPPTGAALLVSPVRRAIVDALADQANGWPDPQAPGGLTAAHLATQLELHVTTVRFHLDQLVAAGLVEAEFSRKFGVGRPRKIYRVAAGSLETASSHESLQLLAEVLAGSFGGAGGTPADAGERWAREHLSGLPEELPAATPGAWLAKVARMIDVLGEWGYTPELSTSEGGRVATIDLADCPFLDLAQSHPAVVCGIHRGLIAGAMDQLGETDIHVSLEPFVQPRRCQAQVRTRTPFTSHH